MSRKKSPVFCNFLHKKPDYSIYRADKGDALRQKNVRERLSPNTERITPNGLPYDPDIRCILQAD